LVHNFGYGGHRADVCMFLTRAVLKQYSCTHLLILPLRPRFSFQVLVVSCKLLCRGTTTIEAKPYNSAVHPDETLKHARTRSGYIRTAIAVQPHTQCTTIARLYIIRKLFVLVSLTCASNAFRNKAGPTNHICVPTRNKPARSWLHPRGSAFGSCKGWCSMQEI
jgi:hypothetical protein